jgi:hypothetical protein
MVQELEEHRTQSANRMGELEEQLDAALTAREVLAFALARLLRETGYTTGTAAAGSAEQLKSREVTSCHLETVARRLRNGPGPEHVTEEERQAVLRESMTIAETILEHSEIESRGLMSRRLASVERSITCVTRTRHQAAHCVSYAPASAPLA